MLLALKIIKDVKYILFLKDTQFYFPTKHNDKAI